MPRLKREHVTGSLPQYDFTDDEVDLAIDRTLGWLTDAVAPAELPDVLDRATWADAVEIAIMVVTNPEGFAQKTVGQTGRMWPIVQRRDELVKKVRERHQRAVSGPSATYPPAPAWPEPAHGGGPLGGLEGRPGLWIVR